MCKMFNEWSDEIKKYCDDNGLSYEKATRLCKSCGKDFMFLQYYDPQKGGAGLLDETPMPLVLAIKRQLDGELCFEQTEYTRKYLA